MSKSRKSDELLMLNAVIIIEQKNLLIIRKYIVPKLANMRDFFVTKTPKLNDGDQETKRKEILKYFRNTVEADEHLFEVFANDEAYYKRADPLRHPLIFYYGHTATFCINKLFLAKLIPSRIDHKFESMFAIGVDEMSWDDLDSNNYNWPAVQEVKAYRQKVFSLVEDVIQRLDFNIPITWESPMWIILMCCEHARIHLETSSVLIRQLPLSDLQEIEGWTICDKDNKPPINKLLPISHSDMILGKCMSYESYGWDNEYGRNETSVEAFETSKYLCSNAEFMSFVENDGYKQEKYWTEEGWNWRNYTKASFPKFWKKEGSDWKLRLVYNEIDMPWSWPVEVNQLEAKAFCIWKSEKDGKPYRLPTEAEWHALKDQAEIANQQNWDVAPGNINMEKYQSPCPVDEFAFGDFYDIIGNVWQWTETPITGYEGFKVHPLYDDFSTPTFDMKHNMIKGGAWISTGNEATHHARYAFRRHFFQHAGFRYVQSNIEPIIVDDHIVTDVDIAQNCHSHYQHTLAHELKYRREIADIASKVSTNHNKVFDLGCEVGRTTFELAKCFNKVIGGDFTARNIDACNRLHQQGKLRYNFPTCGELETMFEVDLSKLFLDKHSEHIEFWQTDPSNLKDHFTDFDMILMNDCLDKMYGPKTFLKEAHHRISKNGVLIIASAYDWQSATTPPAEYIGGYRRDGEILMPLEEMTEILSENFQMIELIDDLRSEDRKCDRSSNFKSLQVTIWRLKE